MRKTLIGLSLLTMLAATAAQAQTDVPPPPHRGGGMMGVRPDAEGNITRAAAMAAADQRFAAMDTDHDGTISAQEMQAYREQRRAEWQARRGGGGGGDRDDRRPGR